jgi:hypothetical protein
VFGLRRSGRDSRPQATPGDSIELVWREGIRLVSAQLENADSLDRKVAPLIALVTAIIAIAIAQRAALGSAAALVVWELGVVLAFLLLSFRLRRFDNVPGLPAFMRWANSPPHEVQLQFMGNLLEAYEQNQRSLAAKELFLRWAIYAMLFVLLSIVVIVATIGGERDGG